MERIKSILASALFGLIVFAGFGFGIMAVGFAIVLGGALALAMRLAGPRIIAEAEHRARNGNEKTFEAAPTAS